MNIVVWMLSGAIVGRLGYSFTAAAAPGDFSVPALCSAAAMAAAALFVRNLVHNRWGV